MFKFIPLLILIFLTIYGCGSTGSNNNSSGSGNGSSTESDTLTGIWTVSSIAEDGEVKFPYLIKDNGNSLTLKFCNFRDAPVLTKEGDLYVNPGEIGCFLFGDLSR